MGIFSRKKKVYVSSVVYNMAGDETERANFLKTTVLGAVIHNKPSISGVITDTYLKGPGMRFRTFARWAERTGYNDLTGLVKGNILTGNSIDNEILAGQIPVSPGSTIQIQSSSIGPGDYTFWADQWIAENYPERLSTNYESDIDEETNTIKITWADSSFSTFVSVGYNPLGSYLYAVYIEESEGGEDPVVTGDTIDLEEGDSFPSIVGWTEISYTDDGEGEIHGVWERTTYMGQAPDRDATYSLKETMYQDTLPGEPEDPPPDPPEEPPPIRSYRIDTQKLYQFSRSSMKVFIYEKETGNAVLDEMFTQGDDMGNFYPFIPFRINNRFVSTSDYAETYPLAKKAYKKATTGDFDKMVEDLSENESLNDIDYAYTVFGVSLNVIENASRKYIYRFFQEIMNDFPETGGAAYDAWLVSWNAAKDSWDAWTAWSAAQSDPGNPLYGTTQPTKLPYPAMPGSSIRIASTGVPVMNYDMTISWSLLQETTGTGLLKPDAKRDELWFTIGGTNQFDETGWLEEGGIWQPGVTGSFAVDEITLNWQETPTTWRKIRIVGLEHRNLIYKGKAVEISAKEALEDNDESGFIIPLHEGIYRSMGLVDGTQMATACSFMVFNCYKVVKQKWYQTTLFKIILIVVAIIIIVVTWGTSTPAVLTALAAALGGTTMAIILAATIFVLASMVITNLITKAAISIFGEKWGAIIGAIVSVIALNVGSAVAAGQSLATAFSGLMSAQNILALTNALGQGYAGYINAATAELAQQNQAVLDRYETESRRIREAWAKNLGTGRAILDPFELTEAFEINVESMDSFLQRTLLTGSEIAGMSLDMLTNFAQITLSTDFQS